MSESTQNGPIIYEKDELINVQLPYKKMISEI